MPLNPLSSIKVGTSEIIAHSTINRGFARLYQNDENLQGQIDSLVYYNTITDDQKAALSSTYGLPSEANKYVTDSDPRLTAIDVNSYSLTNIDITAHSSLALTYSSNGTYSYVLSGFSGGTGFDNTKIRGIWLQCYAYDDSYAVSSNGYVYSKLFNSVSWTLIWRLYRGTGAYNPASSSTGLVFVPVTEAQTYLDLQIASSHGSASFTILGAMIKG